MKIDRKEQKHLEKDVSGFHSVIQKFRTLCPERQRGPGGDKPTADEAKVRP